MKFLLDENVPKSTYTEILVKNLKKMGKNFIILLINNEVKQNENLHL
jgi:hypothetical protein